MGILNFFGFGHDDQKAKEAVMAAERARHSLDIDVAIAAHENWLTRLEAYCANASKDREQLDPDHLACDDKCDLGKWIYSDGEKYLGEFAAFSDLKATHKMFHYKASSIITLCQADQKEKAEQEMAGDLYKLSKKIHQRLEDLKQI